MNNKFRYTEHAINSKPTTSAGWLKLVLTYIVVSPIRLVNEISYKVLFLNKSVIQAICLYAVFINLGFILWSVVWESITNSTRAFIPFPVMLISTGTTIFSYLKLNKMSDFVYETIRGIDENEHEKALETDLSDLGAFDGVEASKVPFEDSINIFIKDPDELLASGISPVIYNNEKEKRILNAIDKRAEVSGYDRIEIPDLSFDSDEFNSKVKESMQSVMEELEQQLDGIY